MNMNHYTVTLDEDENGDVILPLPDEVLAETGWSEGDAIEWTDNKDGTFTMSKSEKPETEFVLVECISTFRMRYVVEVPMGKSDWALDTVSMNEAEEFSQVHLGETITSSWIMNEDEVIEMCDDDNPHFEGWTREQKLASYVTKI